MASVTNSQSILEVSPTRTIHFILQTGAGVPTSGRLLFLNVWLAKNNSSSSTQLFALGVDTGSGRALTEPDATNMPGLYQMRLNTSDLDTVGVATVFIEDSGAVVEDHFISLDVSSRATGSLK